ncbi:MAG: glycosyltransferase, partial [Gemmatimonadales bacterium]|nr:glycosyltransferase [Gemmatimonadales bacterium]
TIVTYTGRLVSYKGLPVLLSVWKRLHERHPSAVLVLVGGGSLDMHDCEEELKRYVRENGLSASVRFTGNVQNVEDYLRASDVFAFPTEIEAFGISLIEAMACELPAVSTPVGGIKDILRHEENGLIVEVGNETQLEG